MSGHSTNEAAKVKIVVYKYISVDFNEDFWKIQFGSKNIFGLIAR